MSEILACTLRWRKLNQAEAKNPDLRSSHTSLRHLRSRIQRTQWRTQWKGEATNDRTSWGNL